MNGRNWVAITRGRKGKVQGVFERARGCFKLDTWEYARHWS